MAALTLKAQLFAYHDHCGGSLGRAFADDGGYIADPGGTLAVHTDPGGGTGIRPAQPFVVDRRCQHFNPPFRFIDIADNLIDPGDDNHLLRPVNHGGDPVTDAIDVN